MPSPQQGQATPQNDLILYPILCKAGIKRDGTVLDGSYYSDGQWCRFRMGRPKKMGGFREITSALAGPIRGMATYSNSPLQVIFSFSGTGVECIQIDNNGVGGAIYTKALPAFTTGDTYFYQWDTLFDATGAVPRIIVHPALNYAAIDNTVDSVVYYGNPTDATAFVSTGVSVSGGCVVLGQYLFLYGTNGLIKNAAANSVTDFATGNANSINLGASKVVKGLPIRGGTSSPAGMFWALDALIRVTFVGGTAKWNYDVVSKKSTILSSNCVIDYEGVFYWVAVDRFLMYNGVVKEVPNTLNQDFFFDNLNWAFRQSVWVSAVPRWGEIWWFFPRYPATECNWAVVYNVREGTWYDTPVTRAQGMAPIVLSSPVWADSTLNTRSGATKYSAYLHETGRDMVVGDSQTAINSYFETSQIGFASGGPAGTGNENPNIQTRITRIEPDFRQVGTMTVQVNGSAQAQSPVVLGSVKSFTPTTGFVDIEPGDRQKRMMTVKFGSNVLGGDYFAGKILMHLEIGDGRS